VVVVVVEDKAAAPPPLGRLRVKNAEAAGLPPKVVDRVLIVEKALVEEELRRPNERMRLRTVALEKIAIVACCILQ
jgi:hypothetical protein